MSSHGKTRDDVMKYLLIAHIFANSATLWKTCEEPLYHPFLDEWKYEIQGKLNKTIYD